MMMFSKLNKWLLLRWRWYRHLSLYVIADASDNSITFSKGLFDILDVMSQKEAKIFVFEAKDFTPSGILLNHYAFTLNPIFEQETQLAYIQYNAKYKTIGFESLCPTVTRIFYDYGLPATGRAKLSVDVCKATGDMVYYKILRPYDKSH